MDAYNRVDGIFIIPVLVDFLWDLWYIKNAILIDEKGRNVIYVRSISKELLEIDVVDTDDIKIPPIVVFGIGLVSWKCQY